MFDDWFHKLAGTSQHKESDRLEQKRDWSLKYKKGEGKILRVPYIVDTMLFSTR